MIRSITYRKFVQIIVLHKNICLKSHNIGIKEKMDILPHYDAEKGSIDKQMVAKK